MPSEALATARYASGVALVAGGSGGIGAAICRLLAGEGANIALTYHRGKDRAEAVARDVTALGRDCAIAPVDLTNEQAVAAFVAQMAARFGGIHTAIYAAGPHIDMRHVSRLEPALFRKTVGTDIFGCYNLIQASIAHLRKSRGAIVALATPAMRRATVKDVMSSAPKAAIESVVRVVAAEEGRNGIRANCVGVGVITDGMYHALKASGDFDDRFMETTKAVVALRSLGTADHVADAVAFLASDRAAYITGQTLMVDGGYAL